MPNSTFFIQWGLFLYSFLVLNFLVFRPVLRILQRRRELTVGAEQEAEAFNEKTDALIAEHSQRMQEARSKGIALKEKNKKEGENEANGLLAASRGELDRALQQARQEIARESKEAQLTLRKYSRDLGEALAEKLLGRKVSA